MHSSMLWTWNPSNKYETKDTPSQEEKDRNLFIKRIYTVVAGQVLFTFIIGTFFAVCIDLNDSLDSSINSLLAVLIVLVAWLAPLFIFVVLVCSEVTREQTVLSPILITILTLFMVWSISEYTRHFVVFTLGMTFVLVVFIVTATTYASKLIRDLTPWCFRVAPFVFGVFFAFALIATLSTYFALKSPELYLTYSCLIILGLIGFLMAYTQLITGGRAYELEVQFQEIIRSVVVLYVIIHSLYNHLLTLIDYSFPT